MWEQLLSRGHCLFLDCLMSTALVVCWMPTTLWHSMNGQPGNRSCDFLSNSFSVSINHFSYLTVSQHESPNRKHNTSNCHFEGYTSCLISSYLHLIISTQIFFIFALIDIKRLKNIAQSIIKTITYFHSLLKQYVLFSQKSTTCMALSIGCLSLKSARATRFICYSILQFTVSLSPLKRSSLVSRIIEPPQTKCICCALARQSPPQSRSHPWPTFQRSSIIPGLRLCIYKDVRYYVHLAHHQALLLGVLGLITPEKASLTHTSQDEGIPRVHFIPHPPALCTLRCRFYQQAHALSVKKQPVHLNEWAISALQLSERDSSMHLWLFNSTRSIWVWHGRYIYYANFSI